jgi:type I restriction enzyme M protein
MVPRTRPASKGVAALRLSIAVAPTRVASLLPIPQTDDKGRVWCPLKGEYRASTPEELVRQIYILHLKENYGYSFEQMGQELRTQHGRRSPRADIVVWESPVAKNQQKTPVVVVECKAESVEIHQRDYYQGESYTRAVGCELFVTHNQRQTAVFKLIPGLPGESVQINELPRAADWGDAARLEEIKKGTRAFSRKEFQELLFKCHGILRDVHKMDPGRAFDTISKILFIKMYVERTGTWGTFTTDYLDKRAEVRLPSDPPVHQQLFELTKKKYEPDELFSERDELDVSEETFRRIVKELERFNLSATGDDVKGLAFEKFLGTTSRGELGQFFTPRPIVNFMVDLLDPAEGEMICDPACGSGGFLSRAYEHIRTKIELDIQAKKDAVRAKVEARLLPEDKEAALIKAEFVRLNIQLDPEADDPPSRIRRLSYECVFGTDAEPRAARTSKMNMIMHGDGHGGIHFHDGLVDINGVFPERFNVVLTNPQFGGNVGEDQKFGNSEQTRIPKDPKYAKRCRELYGEEWQRHYDRLRSWVSTKQKLLDAYEIGKDKPNRPTDLLFLERCLQLLKPGGRMGIVLPDGNLNNPSLAWLRRWVEGKARLLAIVSLPEETFDSADATVKASLVFLRKFTEADEKTWAQCWKSAHKTCDAGFNAERSKLCTTYGPRIACGDSAELLSLMDKAKAVGLQRDSLEWKQADPPAYPRGIGLTYVMRPRWCGEPSDKKLARKLKKEFDDLWTETIAAKSEQLYRELRAALRKVDSAHNKALWKEVRALFDYPVFTAAPEEVGITSTGAEGPDQLPEVLTNYKKYETWLRDGAQQAAIPEFPQ